MNIGIKLSKRIIQTKPQLKITNEYKVKLK